MDGVFTREIKDQIIERALPETLRDTEQFEIWYQPTKHEVLVAVREIHGKVASKLEEDRERIWAYEKTHRLVWTVTGEDGASLTKSPASIQSKIARTLFEKHESQETIRAIDEA